MKFLYNPKKEEAMFNNRIVAFPAVLMILAFLASAGAFAQEPATSLDQLRLLLGKGDKVTVGSSSWPVRNLLPESALGAFPESAKPLVPGQFAATQAYSERIILAIVCSCMLEVPS
jgi:hypothetical protein